MPVAQPTGHFRCRRCLVDFAGRRVPFYNVENRFCGYTWDVSCPVCGSVYARRIDLLDLDQPDPRDLDRA